MADTHDKEAASNEKQKKKEVFDIFDKRKSKRYIEIDEFLQVCKDYELYGTYEKLRDLNKKSLVDYSVPKNPNPQNINQTNNNSQLQNTSNQSSA